MLTLFNPTLYSKNEVYNFTHNCAQVHGIEQFQNGRLESLDVEYVKLEGDCIYFFQVEVKPMSMVKLVLHGKPTEGVSEPKMVHMTQSNELKFTHGNTTLEIFENGLIDSVTEKGVTRKLNE